MKIAVITDDGNTISMHFGRATHYLVLTVEDGTVTHREMRDKVGHQHFSEEGHEHHEHQHGAGHGFDAASQGRHSQMMANIQDCQVLIAGGMGQGAYANLAAIKIEPIITDVKNIEEAVNLYLAGQLPNRVDRLH